MKYNDAEKAMKKLEELYPDREVAMVSAATADSTDDDDARTYSVQVGVGQTVEGSVLEALGAVRDEADCNLAIGPTVEPEGGLVAILS